MAVILIPEYLKNFECLGAACLEPCCGTLVKPGFTREQADAIRQSTDNPVVTAAVRRNRGPQRALVFAGISTDADGHCSLWQEGRCVLRDVCGEEHLCGACRARPLVYTLLGDVYQAAAPSWCPAADSFLFNKEPMEFLYIEQEAPLLYRNLSAEAIGERAQMIDTLRTYTIDVLQDRRISLEKRMLQLGELYDDIDSYTTHTAIESMIDEARWRSSSHTGLSNLLSNPEHKLSFIMTFIGFLMRARRNVEYSHMFAAMFKALRQEGDATSEEKTERYAAAVRKCYEEYFDANEHILENYLVNQVFLRVLPSGHDKFRDSYLLLTIMYAFAKFHLVGAFAINNRLDDQIVTQTLRVVERMFFWDDSITPHLASVLIENKMDSIEKLAILTYD